jgi:TonB family protein
MRGAFTGNARERSMGAAFTTAIHIALVAALLAFRPGFDRPEAPEPPLAIDLVPETPAETPVVEPLPIESAKADDASSLPPGPAERTEAGAPAAREEMDRTLSPLPAASFPPAPAPSAGLSPDGEAGRGRGGDGSGAGSGGGGTGAGSGAPREQALAAPHWITKPTWAQMKQHNPRRAALERVSGTALLACRVDSRRRPRDCRILSEAPRGYGFGSAALAAVRVGRISPVMRDGAPVPEALVGIPVTFRNCRPGDPACADSPD